MDYSGNYQPPVRLRIFFLIKRGVRRNLEVFLMSIRKGAIKRDGRIFAFSMFRVLRRESQKNGHLAKCAII